MIRLLAIILLFPIWSNSRGHAGINPGARFEAFTRGGKRVAGLVEYISGDTVVVREDSATIPYILNKLTSIRGATETKQQFHLRAGAAFLEKGDANNALTILMADFDQKTFSDSGYYYLAEALLGIGNLESALGSHYSISDTVPQALRYAVLVQRLEIFRSIGLIDEAARAMNELIIQFPDSSIPGGHSTAAKKNERHRMVPKVTLSGKVENGYMNRSDLDAVSFSPLNNYVIGDSSHRLESTIRTRLNWDLYKGDKGGFHFHPALIWNTQEGQDYREYLRPELKMAYSWKKRTLEWEMEGGYGIGLWDSEPLVHHYSAGGSVSYMPGMAGVWMLSFSGVLQRSELESQNGYYGNLILSRYPVIRWGEKMDINMWLIAFFMDFPGEDTRKSFRLVFADSILDGKHAREAVYYEDSGYSQKSKQWSEQYGLDKVTSYPAHGQKIGDVFSNSILGISYNADLNYHVFDWLAFFLEGQWEINYFPEPFEWDNMPGDLAYPERRDKLLFMNRMDGKRYFVIQEQAPVKGKFFHSYITKKQTRFDYLYRFRPGIALTIKRLARIRFHLYCDLEYNYTSLDNSSPLYFNYYGFSPGLKFFARF